MFKLKILTIDDEPDILELITATLEDEYEVITAVTAQEGLDKANLENPDILILDYALPDLNGVELCKKLRKNPRFLNTPILMLTGKGETEDKVKGLEAGVDDYMVKPFVPQELIARIRMLLRRSNINLDANPLTRLPGNVSINRLLDEKIRSNEQFAVLYIDLNHFKALNDHYGFDRGDKAIKDTARVLIESVRVKGSHHDFVGHIGGDDFVVITLPNVAEDIAKQIIADFDKKAPLFFDEDDRKKGYIETKGRDGLAQQFGFPSVAIGVISTQHRSFNHVREISSVGAELKKLAKKFDKSHYVTERRNT